MSASRDDEFGFAPDYDAPVPYMQRTRDYYAAIGYTTAYRWAHYTEAPFQPLKKPLSQSSVTIITTAAPYDPTKGDQDRARRIMAARNSTRSMRATRRSPTTFASRISATTASTPRPPTTAPGFRCRNS